MKGGTVQISWHGSDPILSVDFHSTSGLLATAGADRDIKLWSLHHVEKSKALPTPTFKANLSYHSSAVNVIRFSPDGELLASGADGGELVIWRLVQVGEESPSWKVWKTLRFHLKDVLDLEWSMDGASLVSGSVDNTCIIWDVTRGTVQQVLSDHQHYVQGVAWDPALEYVVSLSGDRTCRFYSTRSSTKKTKGKERKEDKDRNIFECKHVLFKKDAAANPCSKADERSVAASKQYLFYDENMPSFFRRLSWSPDGSFLVVPSGVEKHSPEAAPSSLAYVVLREELSKPSPQPTIQLPAGSKPVMGVRFCPVIFTLRSKEHWKHDTTAPFVSPFNLPYRLIFAVATLTCVYIYDTQVSCPIAVLSGLHFAPITDLAWSPDGKFLAVSSQDGYCTLAGFDTGELGLPVSREVCKIEDILGSLAPSSPGQASLMDANTCIEVPKVEKSMKQRADSAVKVKRAKLRRITPKVIPITDFLEALPVGGSRASSSSVVTNSVKSQTHACDGNSLKDNLQQQSTDANGKPPVAESNAACIEQITSANDLEQLDVGSATCSTPSSAPVLPLLPAEETSCTNILTSSAKAPGSSCAQIQMESSGLAEFRKPQDEFAHLYVRPLKGRRITPKPVTDDQCPVTSKPIC